MKKVVVVGAGIAGLTLAYTLAQEKIPVVVLEKEKEVGGLSRSFIYDKFIFDIGPHRFFTTNKKVLEFIKETLKDNYITILRRSGVHFLNAYHLWPLRLKSVFQLPTKVAVKSFIDIFTKGQYLARTESNFENYVLQQYGKTLYETFFKGYTEKFLGISPQKTHSDWAKIGVERATIDKKVTTGSLFLIMRTMLIPIPQKTEFIYPREGCRVFCDILKKKIERLGGEVRLESSPVKIICRGSSIETLKTAHDEFQVEHLFWSGQLNDLSNLLNLGGLNLSYLSLILYNTELASPPLHKFQWCYFGGKDVIFSRMTDPSLFSPNTIPAGKGGLCIEVTCMEGDERWSDPEKLIPVIKKDLVNVKMIRRQEDILSIHPERISSAYPIYEVNYPEHLEAARQKLRVFQNLTPFGRTGLFWYNNMDHSIENAFDICDKYLGMRRGEGQSPL